jgi:hypothetical protein
MSLFSLDSKLVLKDDVKKYNEYKPLIKQVCENLIKTHKNTAEPLLDIEHRTTDTGGEGLTNLFKSFTKK